MDFTDGWYPPYPSSLPPMQPEDPTILPPVQPEDPIFLSTLQNWTSPSRIQFPPPNSQKQPSTYPGSGTVTPAPKTQPTEPTNYAGLLRQYLTIKKDVSSKVTLPKQDETTAPWVLHALTMLDHAERVAEAHLDLISSGDGEIQASQDQQSRMRDSAPFLLVVGSVKNMMKVNRHDEEGVRILRERVKALERFTMDMDALLQ
ncbi:hypothetical protein BDV41DRAFT_571824 [Aspergillus transmontanensis]|uniref:Uncharacterized protein n=1 Tax=Aspergillus transmontanensis TaxID=1034304 RepID=A0A5N6WEV8_9EURO|nr:hypothetical protein BDV41DRAFT_571824 [Aspergillus transmontanensis]